MNSSFYKEKESVEKYIQMAKGHDGRALIEKLRLYVSANSTILELGSGPGTDFEILSKDYQVVGSDYSQEFLTRLKVRFPNEHFFELNAIDLKIESMFDAIYSNKVLHHLTDEELVFSIKRQSNILNDSGIVCHSFWKGEGIENHNGMFVNNHLANELESYFKVHFEMLYLDSYKEFEENDSILLIAKKK